MRGLGVGMVALGIFLSNSGVFDASLEEQAEAAMVESLQEVGVSESSTECVLEGMRDGGYLEGIGESDFDADDFSFKTGLSDAPPEVQHFMEGFFLYLYDPTVGCLSPSELTAVYAAPSGFGSDPDVVAMVESLTVGCREGSLADCDILWTVSEPGSSAKVVAETCGDRHEPLDFGVTTCIFDHQSDADYQILVDECGTGFFLACDALFANSIISSEDEALAASCGGQRDPEWVLPCVATYGFGTRG